MIDNRELSEKFEEAGSSLSKKEALLPVGSQFIHLRILHFFANISIALSSGIFSS
jgi:hypothetical protein